MVVFFALDGSLAASGGHVAHAVFAAAAAAAPTVIFWLIHSFRIFCLSVVSFTGLGARCSCRETTHFNDEPTRISLRPELRGSEAVNHTVA